MPRVSVVIPAFNMGRYIDQSIASALAQTFSDFEVIVVDDGSTDDTSEVVARFGASVRYLRQANAGGNSARNRGVASSDSQYVAFLDADDIWLPQKLARQIALAESRPDPCLIGCGYRVQDASGTRSYETVVRRSFRSRAEFRRALHICQLVPGSGSGAFVHRECLAAVGPFDETIRVAEDWDMWLRLADRFDAWFVEEVLVVIRRHFNKPAFRTLENEELYQTRVIEKNIPLGSRDRAFAMMHARLGSRYLNEGRLAEATHHLWESLRQRPLRIFPLDPLNRYKYPRIPRRYLLFKGLLLSVVEWFNGRRRSR
jgi:glycosyltransferase involved in cell wall biosynthesis